MPRQIPSLIALFLVVTFGSALDVAAIQSDTPFPLDFNAEMVTVGAPPLPPTLRPPPTGSVTAGLLLAGSIEGGRSWAADRVAQLKGGPPVASSGVANRTASKSLPARLRSSGTTSVAGFDFCATLHLNWA